MTVTNVVVGSRTSLTASFVLDPAAAAGPRTVTVTTAGGTSGAQTFTINLPPPGSTTFNFTGSPADLYGTRRRRQHHDSWPPARRAVVVGFRTLGGTGGLGGRTTATVSVTPGASLTVRVGGVGRKRCPLSATAGGFNGGGGSTGNGGGGGGASSVHDGATPLVIAGGGGGGGGAEPAAARCGGGNGGAGGGLAANAGASPSGGGGGGGGGTQVAGGAGGTGAASPLAPTEPLARRIRVELGGRHQPGVVGGGGGGGGYFGGGGGGGGDRNSSGGGGGGGGSSFTAPGATGVVHEQGVNSGNGSVTISW